MIYAARARPWARLVEWRLEDGALTGAGRTHRIADLRAVRLSRGDGKYAPNALLARLVFRNGSVALTSLSFRDRFSPTDQAPELAAFLRAFLAQAAELAPAARYDTGRALIPGLFLGAVGILAVGVLLVLLATVTAGAYALGVELAARLTFALLLMLALWPWIGGLGLRRFDPGAIPHDLLP